MIWDSPSASKNEESLHVIQIFPVRAHGIPAFIQVAGPLGGHIKDDLLACLFQVFYHHLHLSGTACGTRLCTAVAPHHADSVVSLKGSYDLFHGFLDCSDHLTTSLEHC